MEKNIEKHSKNKENNDKEKINEANENKNNNLDFRKYTFYSNKNPSLYDVTKEKIKIFVFFQFCLFLNDKYGKYNIRKIYYDNKFNILDVKEYMIPKNDYVELINTLPKHKYNTYATYNLLTIDIPNEGELIIATSELLSNDTNYYGYATIGN